MQRIKRILRVGVEVGWLQATQGRRFQITNSAPATLPPFAPVMNMLNGHSSEIESAMQYIRQQLKRAFDEVG